MDYKDLITLLFNMAISLVDKGILSKDKLPKNFPKTTEELESFILNVSLKNADKIFMQNCEVIEEWED